MGTAESVASQVQVQHFDASASAAGGGNPCPIITDASGLSSTQMLRIAAHFGQECGFVLRESDALRLRLFVPRHEMAMCVHATVAAVTALVTEGALGGRSVPVQTASGPCAVSWDDSTPPQITVEQQTPTLGPPLDLTRSLQPALQLPPEAMDNEAPVRSVSGSRAKLVVPLRRASDVHAADPDLDLLWTLCRAVETTGVYVFAPHPDGRFNHVVARQFPVDAGFPEDPATGVTAAALAVYLADRRRPSSAAWSEIQIEQGEKMGRPSRLYASAFAGPDGVHRSRVRGQAIQRGEETVDLSDLAPGDYASAPDLR